MLYTRIVAITALRFQAAQKAASGLIFCMRSSGRHALAVVGVGPVGLGRSAAAPNAMQQRIFPAISGRLSKDTICTQTKTADAATAAAAAEIGDDMILGLVVLVAARESPCC